MQNQMSYTEEELEIVYMSGDIPEPGHFETLMRRAFRRNEWMLAMELTSQFASTALPRFEASVDLDDEKARRRSIEAWVRVARWILGTPHPEASARASLVASVGLMTHRAPWINDASAYRSTDPNYSPVDPCVDFGQARSLRASTRFSILVLNAHRRIVSRRTTGGDGSASHPYPVARSTFERWKDLCKRWQRSRIRYAHPTMTLGSFSHLTSSLSSITLRNMATVSLGGVITSGPTYVVENKRIHYIITPG